MNKKQIIILWVVIMLLVVTWVYPNWIVVSDGPIIHNLGYSLFWKPAKSSPDAYFCRINIERSIVQSIIILLIFSGLLVTFKDKK